MKNQSVLTVSQLNFYMKSLLDGDPVLQNVFLAGEISNFTNHYRSGHFYLSLKDDKCVVKAVMFASHASRVRFRPENGMRVLVRGRVSVYEASGQYQLYIEDMQPDGVGALNLAFEQLKEKLGKEGLFDPSRKKTLPVCPERIGVITSPTGAAVRDIESVLGRRYPLAELVFCPVLVQGEGAPAQIADALDRMNRLAAADVIIVGRGGGSLEELWAFNTEEVAYAVSRSVIPVVSAVGHETDFTICDFAADLRAPTPSAAAELVAPDIRDLFSQLDGCALSMRRSMEQKLLSCRMNLDHLQKSHHFVSPMDIIEQRRMRLDALSARAGATAGRLVTRENGRIAALAGRLESLSPLAVLSRGYAIAFDGEGRPLRSVEKLSPGDELTLRLNDGAVDCAVLAKKEVE